MKELKISRLSQLIGRLMDNKIKFNYSKQGVQETFISNISIGNKSVVISVYQSISDEYGLYHGMHIDANGKSMHIIDTNGNDKIGINNLFNKLYADNAEKQYSVEFHDYIDSIFTELDKSDDNKMISPTNTQL